MPEVNQGKMVRLNVEVPESLRTRIKIMAISKGVTMNQLILEALQERYILSK